MKRNIQNVDDDLITMKRRIKQKLIADHDILEALHNTKLTQIVQTNFWTITSLDLLEFQQPKTLFEILFVLPLMISRDIRLIPI